MSTVILYTSALLAVAVVVLMLIKKMDIKITLFFIGILLMFVAMGMGNEIAIKEFESTGVRLLDPLKAIADQFKSIITSSGFIILILGGYSSYMSYIKANDVTVSLLTKPIKKIKSVYILVPVVFLLGNLLSLVIPSASNLSIILLATLYPIMVQSGMTALTAGAIIATTATIIPTPLGSDNVAIAAELANTPEFAGLTASDYVFKYHALVSIPTLLFMAVVHYIWQKFCDKKVQGIDETVEVKKIEEVNGSVFYKLVYGLLPLLPILMLIGVFLLQSVSNVQITLSVEVAVLFSIVIAIFCELIRTRDGRGTLDGTEAFFKGMGSALPIVALLVAGTIFVTGLQSIGIIRELQESMTNLQGSGMGFVLPLLLVLLTILIVVLSGSGTALFFAMVPLMVPLAQAAGISVLAISVPMGLAGNLLRAVSPVSAVIMIVAGTLKKEPLELVKRTSVPMIAGVIFMFILTMVMFL